MPQVFTGKVEFKNTSGDTILTIDPDSTFVQIIYNTTAGAELMTLSNSGNLTMGLGGPGARLDGFLGDLFLGGNGKVGTVRLRDGNGNDIIVLDGAVGDIILANADCAEDFEVGSPGGVEAGTVMVLSEGGGIVPSESPYDRKVAGVVSGAGGLRPGIVLGRQQVSSLRCPLALVGKVYCKADASYGPIGLGDMLTTSSTRGHAMRATDPMQAFGAVLGKALGELSFGQGLVPVLVALQ